MRGPNIHKEVLVAEKERKAKEKRANSSFPRNQTYDEMTIKKIANDLAGREIDQILSEDKEKKFSKDKFGEFLLGLKSRELNYRDIAKNIKGATEYAGKVMQRQPNMANPILDQFYEGCVRITDDERAPSSVVKGSLLAYGHLANKDKKISEDKYRLLSESVKNPSKVDMRRLKLHGN